MKNNKTRPLIIETERFILKELVPDDVTERYCAWMNDVTVKQWITGAQNSQTIESLRAYVLLRMRRTDVYFFGIFDKIEGIHIGNIKYEPVVPNLGAATMGVLIGDKKFRGKRVFNEVFIATIRWLNKEHGIKSINLGVNLHNTAALKAYLTSGFEIKERNGKSDAIMVFNLYKN